MNKQPEEHSIALYLHKDDQDILGDFKRDISKHVNILVIDYRITHGIPITITIPLQFFRDVYIYIKTHPVEFVAGGVVANAVYDVFKTTIKTVWRSFTRTRLKRLRTRIVIGVINNFPDDEVRIRFFIDSYKGNKDIDTIISLFEKFIDSGELITPLNNNNGTKRRYRLGYNEKTGKWEAKLIYEKMNRKNASKTGNDSRNKW